MTAENHSVKDSASLHQLTFHIVDSAMGAGKSESLLDRARFNGGWGYIRYPEEVERLRRNGWKGEFKGERCIIFVSTKKERDERFVKELDMATPEKYPYNRSILDLIRSGRNIITTQALWSLFNEETIAAFRESDYLYTAFFDEVPPLFREVVGSGRRRDDFGELVTFGPADVKLMQEQEMLVNVKGQLRYNSKCEYDRRNSEHKVFDAVKNLSRSCNLYPYGTKNGKFTSIVAFVVLFLPHLEQHFAQVLPAERYPYGVLSHSGSAGYAEPGRKVCGNLSRGHGAPGDSG